MIYKGMFISVQIKLGTTGSNTATLNEVLNLTEVKFFNESQIKILTIFEDQADHLILPTPLKRKPGEMCIGAPQIPPARSDDKILMTLQALPRVGP